LQPRLRYPGRLAFLWALLMYRQRIAWEDYWTLRERLEQDEVDSDPDYDKLAAQLGSIKCGIASRGRIKIESKDDMRNRGLPSPHHAAFRHLIQAVEE
jgi:hypothetical protein